MKDETRKALDKIFKPRSSKIQPLGASRILQAIDGEPTEYRGKFEILGTSLNLFRQLYDDAIAADDAAKLAADAKADADAKAVQDTGDR